VPKTQGVVSAIAQIGFALKLLRHGKVPPPFPPHVAEEVGEARALYNIVKEQGRDGALGIVQGERALARLEHPDEGDHGTFSEVPEVVLSDPASLGKDGKPVPTAGAGRDAPEITPGEEPPHAEG
jgi:hypothetical protein